MLELIGRLLLVYYLVLGATLVVLLAWGWLDDCRRVNRCRRPAPPCLAAGAGRTGPAEAAARRGTQKAGETGTSPDNVVKFQRHRK